MQHGYAAHVPRPHTRAAACGDAAHALPAGDQFALFEAVVALAMLVRRYDFRLAPAAPRVGMTTGATIHTSAGLHMFLTPRKHGQPVSHSIALWL